MTINPCRRLARLFIGAAAAASFLLVGTVRAEAAGGACPTDNRPNILRIVAGSTQTAQLEKPFQTNLQVELANSNGCPLTGELAGISVDFSAPSSGAGGTFAGSGTRQITVGTDSRGVATAPTFTANEIAGTYSIHADSDYGSVVFYLTNTAGGIAASIAAADPTSQEASVNARFTQPLQVDVRDANGRPVQGATVTFSLVTGATGAGATFLDGGAQATVTTKSNGRATSPQFVANGTPGRFTATASTGGVAATFTLINHAATRRIVGASAVRAAPVETRYRQPLAVRVLDVDAQPVEGAAVTFTITTAAGGAGASFLSGEAQATRLTDVDGWATSPLLVANKVAGRFTATATVTGSGEPVTYALRNVAGKPAAVSAGGATGQSAPVGTRFPIRLAVKVTDADDNPVAGSVVTFTAPARGSGGRFAGPAGGDAPSVRARTNENGVAIAPAFVANRIPGGYVVTARVAGTDHRAAFALVNQPRR